MSWNDYILSEFPVEAFKQITIMFDPQSIVADELIFSELEKRGYQIHEYTDTMLLRYTYEMFIRNNSASQWIIIVRGEDIALTDLPYDISRQARKLSFALGDIFPTLNFAVIDSLDRKYIPILFDVRKDIPYGILGREQTCDFILKRLFSISPEIINTVQELIQVLFAVHLKYSIRSEELLKYLSKRIAAKNQFHLLDISSFLSSDVLFATFMQQKLFEYLDEKNANAFIDFNLSEIKKGIAYLLTTGLIRIGTDIELLQKIAKYLGGEGNGTLVTSLNTISADIEARIPGEQDQHQSWLRFAKEWAEFSALCISIGTIPISYKPLQNKINNIFATWQKTHYHLLASLPPQTPIMVHQIIRSISRKMTDGKIKSFALIVIDGLAFNQWAGMRPILEEQFSISTDGCFALLPSLTSISRQAIFAGKLPAMFADSISTTAKEESLWVQAWENCGLTKSQILYRKRLGDGSVNDALDLISPQTKVCGFVIDKIDSIMHGMQLGNAGMHNQLKLWMSTGYLQEMLTVLIHMGFDVMLTSDHGNIECTGIGKIQDGVLAEQHGERVRIYSQRELALEAIKKIPQAFEIRLSGIPSNLFPISLPSSLAFANSGVNLVAHGGNSIEETIVPFVHIQGIRGK